MRSSTECFPEEGVLPLHTADIQKGLHKNEIENWSGQVSSFSLWFCGSWRTPPSHATAEYQPQHWLGTRT